MQIEAGPKMSPSYLYQINVRENNEITSIPYNYNSKNQNKAARYQTIKSPMMWYLMFSNLWYQNNLFPAQGSSLKQRKNQGYQGQTYWRNNLNYIHNEIYPYLLTSMDDYTE